MAGDPLIKHDALADDDIAEKLSESVAKRLDGVEDSGAGAEDEGDDDETTCERAKSERTFIMHA